ncbi:hypothetical protein Syun_000727 [Stephania yunnanensis]|uniref:Helitron helicase-like domain-containing protein n=1 Tax=Stephania yunnanensis TaxID=152371 RepID=A0AAP0LE78_9MAGN
MLGQGLPKSKLRYLKTNQHIIHSELYQGLQDATNSRETTAGNIGRRIILPSSYIGSPRDMYNDYQDAMAIVRREYIACVVVEMVY